MYQGKTVPIPRENCTSPADARGARESIPASLDALADLLYSHGFGPRELTSYYGGTGLRTSWASSASSAIWSNKGAREADDAARGYKLAASTQLGQLGWGACTRQPPSLRPRGASNSLLHSTPKAVRGPFLSMGGTRQGEYHVKVCVHPARLVAELYCNRRRRRAQSEWNGTIRKYVGRRTHCRDKSQIVVLSSRMSCWASYLLALSGSAHTEKRPFRPGAALSSQPTIQRSTHAVHAVAQPVAPQ